MFKNSKISNVVIFGLLSGIFIPIIITYMFIINSHQERSDQTMDIIIETISASAKESLWFFSSQWTKNVVISAVKNKKVYSVAVNNSKKELIAYSKDENPILNTKEKIILLSKEGEVVGSLTIVFNMDEINGDLYIEKRNHMLILFLQAIISSLILYFIIKYKVLVPIKKLISQSSFLRNKKLDQVFEWEQQDEVGKLGQSLEETRYSLLELFKKEQKAQRKIKFLNMNLQTKIKEEIQKNEIQTRHLIHKSKLAQMGELLNMIAHQWRQPLNSISVIANNILLQRFLGKDIKEEEIEKDITLILDSTQLLSSTITDFRNFYQIDKEKENITYEHIIEKTLKIMTPLLETYSIKLNTELNCSKNLHSFPTQIIQVLLNLLKNSQDALIEKQIKNPWITIKTYTIKNNAYLEVSDNAGGIKKEHLKIIFDPYFTTKANMDGSGLGLYMSKTIIENHCKGTLGVKNSTNGAVFTISIDFTQ